MGEYSIDKKEIDDQGSAEKNRLSWEGWDDEEDSGDEEEVDGWANGENELWF